MQTIILHLKIPNLGDIFLVAIHRNCLEKRTRSNLIYATQFERFEKLGWMMQLEPQYSGFAMGTVILRNILKMVLKFYFCAHSPSAQEVRPARSAAHGLP